MVVAGALRREASEDDLAGPGRLGRIQGRRTVFGEGILAAAEPTMAELARAPLPAMLEILRRH